MGLELHLTVSSIQCRKLNHKNRMLSIVHVTLQVVIHMIRRMRKCAQEFECDDKCTQCTINADDLCETDKTRAVNAGRLQSPQHFIHV